MIGDKTIWPSRSVLSWLLIKEERMKEKDIENALVLVGYVEKKLKKHNKLVSRLDLISRERIDSAILYLQMAEDHLKLEQRREGYAKVGR